MLTKKDFFFCYNRKMMLKLKDRGFKFILCAKHEVSDNKFWMFERTPELDKAIGEISEQFKKNNRK